MYQQNNVNRYSPPVCVCGHAKNLHKFGSVDCNGSHSGSSFMSKPSKCKCLLFTDVNPLNHQKIVPFASGEEQAVVVPTNSQSNPRTESSVSVHKELPASKTARTKEEIQAMLELLQQQLDNTR